MAGANYMGGKKNAAKIRSRDAAGRQQKRFFGRQRLNLLSKRRSINSPTSRNQPQPSISLAHAKQNSTLQPQGYIPSPSKPPKSKRDGPSSASNSSKVLEALDTSEPMFLRAAMNQILSLPDLAGLYAYKKRIRVSDISSPEARRSKRIKSELSPEKDEELFFGSQNDRLCDSLDPSSRDIYHNPDSDEYDEEPDDTFFQAHLGSHTTSGKSSQLSPILAPPQKTSHIPTRNDVAQATSSFGTLAVTSSLQTSFSGNIFDYDDPWTAVGVILGLQSAPSTPEKDADNTSALAKQPRPPVLAHQRRRVRLTAHSSSNLSSEGIPVASSHSSDNFPPPPRVDEDDSYSQSDDFHFGEDDSDHDFDDHDIAAHVHQKLPPLHLESYPSSAYFSSSNDYFNNLAHEPVAHEGNDPDPPFDHNSLLDGSTSDCHSLPVINGEEDYAGPEDPDDYTLFETSSWAILDAGQCIEEPVPADYSSGLRSPLVECPSPDSLHEQDPLTTAKTASVSLLHRSSPSVAPRFNTNEDVLHFAQQVSPNASACSSRHFRVDRSLRASHSSPANASLCPIDDAQDDGCLSAALPISTRIDTPNSDSLVRHSQVADDPEPAFELTPAPELIHETFSTDKIVHSAYSPAPICRDEPVEVVAPQSFVGFCLFSRDDFLQEPDSDD
ncbi:uncharacterized protein EV420DRAFT_1757707 [Desarmillaria tabescens]|uniref:Uncharacterized protein n=1 Tax=Armillaria tabescens TaxID=1929756 RepID=A0AA39NQP2_ARMTA|nr:uncharacterized protein EV420DRAFT_1757707 [Desarmillaria tabescens]KAK0470087.1 hypothetical protein EV420DRAFT_1757707 [Desarmillaria tabescens]